jgi:general stress protein YciG
MSEDGEGFLARWSRRKVEIQREEARAPDPLPEAPEPVEAEPEITPEEIEALPKVEELTVDTDISVFLRKGIPEALKNAALRRMWTLDPAIRDFRSEALDYAYDWNVPGGVPGNGPLLPTDDVGAMLRRILGDPPAEAPPEAPRGLMSQDREPAAEAAAEGGEDTADAEAAQASPEEPKPLAEHSVRLGRGLPEADPSAPAEEAETVPVEAPKPVQRRHGGAKPV